MTGNTTDIQVPEVMHFENLTGNGTTPTPAASLQQEPPPEPKAAEPPKAAPEGEPPPRERTQREIAMEAIFKRRVEAIKKEQAYGEEMADNARTEAGLRPLERTLSAGDEPPPAPEVVVPPAAAAPQAPPAAPPPEAQVADRVVTVGGQQYRVTQQQMEQLASVGAIAINAMQQQQRAQQQPQLQPQQQPPQQRPQQPPQAILTPEETKQIATRVQYGNETESAQALADMASLMAQRIMAAQPQLNPQAVVQYATQQAMQQMEQKMALERNLNQIGVEYPEIFSDKSLSQLAALKLHDIRQSDALVGNVKPDLVAYREACEEVRKAIGYQPPAPQPQPTPNQGNLPPAQAAQPVQGRFEAKRAAPRSPQPAQRTAAAGDQGTRFPTPSEIVSSMKRSRGQAF